MSSTQEQAGASRRARTAVAAGRRCCGAAGSCRSGARDRADTSTGRLRGRVHAGPAECGIGFGSPCQESWLLYKSADGGMTWRATSLGLDYAPGALALDPQLPTTLYAAAGGAILTSTDAGATWQSRVDGLPSPPNTCSRSQCAELAISLLAVDPQQSGTVYAGSWGTEQPRPRQGHFQDHGRGPDLEPSQPGIPRHRTRGRPRTSGNDLRGSRPTRLSDSQEHRRRPNLGHCGLNAPRALTGTSSRTTGNAQRAGALRKFAPPLASTQVADAGRVPRPVWGTAKVTRSRPPPHGNCCSRDLTRQADPTISLDGFIAGRGDNMAPLLG